MSLRKNIARAMTAAMVLGTIASFSPAAMAASATNIKDTMTRSKEGAVSATHVLTMTIPALADTATVTFDYSTAGFVTLEKTAEVSGAGATGITGAIDADDVVLSCSNGCVGGAISFSFTSATSPSNGNHPIAISSTVTTVNGSLAVATVDEDQVVVTATVDPFITFDVDTDASCAAADGTGTIDAVPFGSLTPGSYDNQADLHICVSLETNATAGASVGYMAANKGFSSTIAGYTMGTQLSDGEAVANVATNNDDGLFVSKLDVLEASWTDGTRTQSLAEDAAYGDGNANLGTTGVAVSTAWDVLAASTSPVDGTGYQTLDIQLGAFAEVITPAAPDYTNTLTFLATGTF